MIYIVYAYIFFVNFDSVDGILKKLRREKTLRFEMRVVAQEDVRRRRWGIRDNLGFKNK